MILVKRQDSYSTATNPSPRRFIWPNEHKRFYTTNHVGCMIDLTHFILAGRSQCSKRRTRLLPEVSYVILGPIAHGCPVACAIDPISHTMDVFGCRAILTGTGITLFNSGCHPFRSETKEDKGSPMLRIFAEKRVVVSHEKVTGGGNHPAHVAPLAREMYFGC